MSDLDRVAVRAIGGAAPAARLSVTDYVAAAQRANTRRSYASGVRHFEESWGGVLPASPQQVADYLAAHAQSLSLNTLRSRLAALARWHAELGFADPTRSELVRQTLKGIQALHPAQEKRAAPLQLTEVAKVATWLQERIATADTREDRSLALRCRRDLALLLLGFWRGFRIDELVHVRIEHLTLIPGEGMTLFLPRTKGDRPLAGTTYRLPALSRWCPVSAILAWLDAAGLHDGPVFRRIGRWGQVGASALHGNSVVPLLRRLFAEAGLAQPDVYSGHSLRRGFAGWANRNGWDVKALMEYVGWKDVHSAMRYMDTSDAFGRDRIESALADMPNVSLATPESLDRD
jgi:integrase